MFLRVQASPASSWPPAQAAMAVKIAAAAREHRLGVPGVCLGDSARRRRARGRYGDSDCLGGPLFPSLGGCGGHRGQQQDHGHTHAFRAPPAPRSAQHRPWSFYWGARSRHPKLRWSPNFLGVAARTPGSWKLQIAALGPPRGGGEGRGGCCSGWERQPLRLARSLPRSAASEVSALKLPPLGLKACGFPPLSPRLPVSSLSNRPENT